ncbi:MAG: hypothetical protein E6767_04235 [Dysgonomonas sp.]|nr:hypothetical protein [Dysgonomonas sp.]
MKKIHLIPTAGLGNRLRTISSVYNFCRNNHIELVIHWHRQYGLNATFSSLFESIPNSEIIDCNPLDFFTYNVPMKYNLFLPRLLDKCFHRKVIYGLGLNKLGSLDIIENLIVSTYSQQGELYPLDKLFRPIMRIQKIIDDFTSQFGAYTIGCHIRRTDNTISINNSSVDKFEKKFEELFSINPTAQVFLCTDDLALKSYLTEKYSGRILTYNSTLNRNSTMGIRDAVVELWLLSMTKEIWGSYWSSFTDMAVLLRNVKYTIIK